MMTMPRLSSNEGWRLNRATAVVGLAALCVSTACGPDPTSPIGTIAPPEVVAFVPPPRSTGIPHDTEISISFSKSLDASTISVRTVFLKVDALRLAVGVSVRDSGRTILLRPENELNVRRTHTVRIAGSVSSLDGVPLGRDIVWQFTTLGVRPISWMTPSSEVAGPFRPLQWQETEPTAGNVEYRVRLGPDSATVAGGGAETYVTKQPYFLPESPWVAGAKVYWDVTVYNRTSNDMRTSAISAFEVYEAGAPIDSLLIGTTESGTWDGRAQLWRCPDIVAGDQRAPVLVFDFEGMGAFSIAGARLILLPRTGLGQTEPSLWELARDEAPCRSESKPPIAATRLGDAVLGDLGIGFASATFSARVQARLLGIPFPNYTIRTARGSVDFDPLSVLSGIMIYRYRDGVSIRRGAQWLGRAPKSANASNGPHEVFPPARGMEQPVD